MTRPYADVPAGTEVHLPAGTWPGKGELRLHVCRTMHELNRHAPAGEVWVEGNRIGWAGPGAWVQVSVKVDAGAAPTPAGHAETDATWPHWRRT